MQVNKNDEFAGTAKDYVRLIVSRENICKDAPIDDITLAHSIR